MKVCVVGGGPAGMMLGFLLARAGIEVDVLEKHKDFLRDFRGDTVHPSTIELMHELGLLDEFLGVPHNPVRHIGAFVEDEEIQIADFTHLPVKCPYVAFMPQWDFLNFIADQARNLKPFHLHMETEATKLIEQSGRVVGVKTNSKEGPVDFRADLVVGADGRGSIIRASAGLEVQDLGAPMDVLWMRISHQDGDPPDAFGRIRQGRFMFMINRQTYWQCAYVIRKGAAEAMKAKGLAAFQEEVRSTAPFLGDRVKELKDWDQVKLLTVKVDRLTTWHRPGLLCIGDSAHAMSPVGGVGINLAIQDAVAASNILTPSLLRGSLDEGDLAAVQTRRTFPTKMTQGMQVFVQNNLLNRVLGNSQKFKPPLFMRLLQKFPILRRIPARIVGLGFRPEHIHTSAAS